MHNAPATEVTKIQETAAGGMRTKARIRSGLTEVKGLCLSVRSGVDGRHEVFAASLSLPW